MAGWWHCLASAGQDPEIDSFPSPAIELSPRSLDLTIMVLHASAARGGGKLITKVDIPTFVPRQDLASQLERWAIIEVQENGLANVGMACKVAPYHRDGELWGFTVSFLQDGTSATDLRVAFDEEAVSASEWVSRGAGAWAAFGGAPASEQELGLWLSEFAETQVQLTVDVAHWLAADGFPSAEGTGDELRGRTLEIRKVDELPASDTVRSAARAFCQLLAEATNKYYAFGSIFADDST